MLLEKTLQVALDFPKENKDDLPQRYFETRRASPMKSEL